ncbi:hypothetical protein REPUB_Repub02eG0121700 [Reevesia pubescens]
MKYWVEESTDRFVGPSFSFSVIQTLPLSSSLCKQNFVVAGIAKADRIYHHPFKRCGNDQLQRRKGLLNFWMSRTLPLSSSLCKQNFVVAGIAKADRIYHHPFKRCGNDQHRRRKGLLNFWMSRKADNANDCFEYVMDVIVD